MVNLVAVFGTTLLMMAVSTVWYSSILFGSLWLTSLGLKDEHIEKSKQKIAISLGLTFVSYFIVLVVLSYVSTVAPLLALSSLKASLLATLFAGALFAWHTLSERKSLQYYLINIGFIAVFIIGGTLVLQYWPW